MGAKTVLVLQQQLFSIADNGFKISLGVSGWTDSFAGCSLGVLNDEISGVFDIVLINETTIIVEVIRTGEVENVGSCDSVYEYEFANTEQWLFLKQ